MSVGVHVLEHDATVDDALRDVGAARQVVHHVEQHLFEDGAQAAGAGAPLERLVGDRLERVVGEARGRRRRTGRTSGTA